ncbi:MAG: hypothetical protein H2057_05195 [Alphaproteobacteria bacterium]|nr:hypothetical protein [Alphaproteobacteria bacterium]
MKKLYGWALCLGLLAGPVFGSAEDEEERGQHVGVTKVNAYDTMYNHVSRLPNGFALQAYLNAQIEFFWQKGLYSEFVATKAIYQLLLKALVDEVDAWPAYAKEIRQTLETYRAEGLAASDDFLKKIDDTSPAVIENCHGAQAFAPRKSVLQELCEHAPEQVLALKHDLQMPASALAMASKNRDVAALLSYFKGIDELHFLRQHAALSLLEKTTAEALEHAESSPELRKNLTMSVEWSLLLPIIFSPALPVTMDDEILLHSPLVRLYLDHYVKEHEKFNFKASSGFLKALQTHTQKANWRVFTEEMNTVTQVYTKATWEDCLAVWEEDKERLATLQSSFPDFKALFVAENLPHTLYFATLQYYLGWFAVEFHQRALLGTFPKEGFILAYTAWREIGPECFQEGSIPLEITPEAWEKLKSFKLLPART